MIVCLIRHFAEILNELRKTKEINNDKKSLFYTTASQTSENYVSLEKENSSEQKIPNESTDEVSVFVCFFYFQNLY